MTTLLRELQTIGGGPAGFAAANQAIDLGIGDITIYDPSGDKITIGGSKKIDGAKEERDPKILSNDPKSELLGPLRNKAFQDILDRPGEHHQFGEDELVPLEIPGKLLTSASHYAVERGYFSRTNCPVEKIVVKPQGGFDLHTHAGVSHSPHLVVAPGAKEVQHRSFATHDKAAFFLSGSLITEAGKKRFARSRARCASNEVHIFGVSHSGLSAALKVLDLEPHARIILHQRAETKIFHADANEAAHHGYNFPASAVDPDTRAVFRFLGVRGPAKEFILGVRQGKHPRVEIHTYEGEIPIETILAKIGPLAPTIQAFGSTPRKLPWHNEHDKPLVCTTTTTEAGYATLSANGEHIRGAIAIGTGHSPSGHGFNNFNASVRTGLLALAQGL